MSKKLRNTLAVLFVLAFLLNGGLLLQQWVHDKNAQQAQEQAEQAADVSVLPVLPEPEIPVKKEMAQKKNY